MGRKGETGRPGPRTPEAGSWGVGEGRRRFSFSEGRTQFSFPEGRTQMRRVRAGYGRASPAPSARGLALVTRLALRPLTPTLALAPGTRRLRFGPPLAPQGGLRCAARTRGVGGVGAGDSSRPDRFPLFQQAALLSCSSELVLLATIARPEAARRKCVGPCRLWARKPRAARLALRPLHAGARDGQGTTRLRSGPPRSSRGPPLRRRKEGVGRLGKGVHAPDQRAFVEW